LGTFDERRRRGWLEEDEFREASKRFADEALKLLRLRVLDVVPVLTPILAEAWPLIMNQRMYEADAIQISTCAYSNCRALLSSDRSLIEAARKSGLEAVDIEKEEGDVRKLIQER